MAGRPYLIRFAGFGFRAPKNPALGMDLAGVVEAVGSNVTRFRPGDEVFGVGMGSFGEYALARENKLAPKPQNLSFEQAAAVGISGMTALQALRDHGRIQSGQDVLIIGASGGVGVFAVQVAKTYGARVTGVCSSSKVDMVRSIGADDVIDYTRADFSSSGHRYDLILDIGGSSPLSRLRRALKPKGTLVIVGGEGGGAWFGGIDRQLRAMILSSFISQKLITFICNENHKDLIVLGKLIESGKVAPVIDRTYPLADASAAIRYMTEGRARGKVVITI
jgi:NADPH:quinone reductase-like Zn-dependent oxidoreductase